MSSLLAQGLARAGIEACRRHPAVATAPASLAARCNSVGVLLRTRRVHSLSRSTNAVPSRRPYTTSSSFETELAKLETKGNYNLIHKRRVMNTVINIIPQQEAYVVERLGKFAEVLHGGIHFLIPFVDRIAYCFSLKEEALIIPSRAAITQDNVRVHVIGVLYFRVIDPQKAAYGAGDPIFALTQLAQTTLRSILGEMTLDESFHERDKVNKKVVQVCNEASTEWGIHCLRHEIREIIPPDNVLHAMEMQMEAERRKRVEILQSEGKKQSEINTAQGQKAAVILNSEAAQQQQINEAQGNAEAIRLQAEAESAAILARAQGAAAALERLASAITQNGGHEAVTFQVALKYVEAFEKLAQQSTTMILPSNTGDVSSMIAQATTVFSRIQEQQQKAAAAAAAATAAAAAAEHKPENLHKSSF